VIHVGGGFDYLLHKGLGATGEIGLLAPTQSFGSGIGVFNLGGIYTFNRDRKTVPFATGGYTLFFREGTLNGFFLGGGINHWISNKWGIRIEGRDQVMPNCGSFTHSIEARFALVIR
jgi:hypothetical protein